MILFQLMVYLSIGQTNLNKYPYAQIKNNKLEFVFSPENEKQLRYTNEIKKNCYKYTAELQLEVLKRDTIIEDLLTINRLQEQKERQYKNDEFVLNAKYRALNERAVEIQDQNNKLLIDNKNLELDKAKWKNRTFAITTLAMAALALKFLL